MYSAAGGVPPRDLWLILMQLQGWPLVAEKLDSFVLGETIYKQKHKNRVVFVTYLFRMLLFVQCLAQNYLDSSLRILDL